MTLIIPIIMYIIIATLVFIYIVWLKLRGPKKRKGV
jgi:uncharacterized membrane protein